MGVSAAAFFIEGGPIVMAVSGVCAFLGPAAAMQQHRLTDLESTCRVSLEEQKRERESLSLFHFVCNQHCLSRPLAPNDSFLLLSLACSQKKT